MKAIQGAITVTILFLAAVAGAQPRYGIFTEPVCWTTPGGRDSSITRLVLISSPGGKQTLGYIDQYANGVNVDGVDNAELNAFRACYCEELPGYVYPPPGGLNVLFISYPVINPLNPQCFFSISFDVEFAWEVGDVTATFDGQAATNIQKSGNTLIITSDDQLPLGNCGDEDYPHTWVVTVSNQFGSDSKTVIVPAL